MLDGGRTHPGSTCAGVGAIPGCSPLEDGTHRLGRLLLLLTAHAAGIVWADRGGPWPAWVLNASAWGAGGLGLAVAIFSVAGSRASAGHGLLGRSLRASHAARRTLAVLGLAPIAFSAGHRALARELVRAESGAALAEGLDPTAHYLIDARVRARRVTGFGEEVELWDVRGRPGEPAVPERLLLPFASSPGADLSRAERILWPGARVRLAVRITPLRPARNPGSPDRAHEWARHGLAARARLVKPDWVVERVPIGDPGERMAAALARLRRDLGERIRVRLEKRGEGEGLVRALAVGDRRGLSEETRRAFGQLGLAHLLSVSGLHIGFVALPAAWLLARVRVARRSSPRVVLGFLSPVAAGCLAGGCYAWLTGGEVPALRSSLLLALFGVARLLGGAIAPATALAAIALLLLVVDPAHLFDPGARFSFGACVALIGGGSWGGAPPRRGVSLASPPLARGAPKWMQPGLGAIGEAMRTSLAVSLGMLPLVELYGLPRSLPSPIVNALAIPFAGFVVLPCALAASVLACGSPEGALDALLSALLRPATWLERAARTVAAQTPASWIGEDRPGRIAWPLALALIGLGLAGLRRGRFGSAAVAWLLLAMLGIASIRPASFDGPLPRVVFFDVGQADAALIQAKDAAWLIDSGSGPEDGSGGRALLRAIRAQGVGRLDVLVVTHGDLDHRGGALRILSVVEVDELWLPSLPAPDPDLEALAEAAAARDVRVRRVAAGDRSEASPAMTVDVLWPPRLPPRAAGAGRSPGLPAARLGPRPGRARNESSIVLRVELEGLRILLTADVGGRVEDTLRASRTSLRSDVLKVGHHGSRQGSTDDFLAAVAPRIAIVTAPCGGGRGLPSPSALARLHAAGTEIGWTGRDGAIALARDRAGRLAMRYWGTPRRCAVGFSRAETTGRRAG